MKKDELKKILICGSPLSGNMGGPALVFGTIRSIKKYLNPTFFSLISFQDKENSFYGPKYGLKIIAAKLYELPLSNLKCLAWSVLRRFGLEADGILENDKILKAYHQAEVVVNVTGISFHETFGKIVIIKHFLWLMLAFLMGKPVIIYSQSLGPFKSGFNRMLAKYALDRVDALVVRGKISEKYLRDLGIKKPIYIRPDVGFLLNDEFSPRIRRWLANNRLNQKQTNIIGITVNQVIGRRLGSQWDHYKNVLVETVDYLTKINQKVILIPHSQEDRDLTEQIHQKTQDKKSVFLIKERFRAEEFKALIGRCDLLIGSRFHSIVAALSMAVPPLVIGWSHKYQELMSFFDLEGLVMNFGSETHFQDIRRKIDNLRQERSSIARKILARRKEINAAALSAGLVVKKVISDENNISSISKKGLCTGCGFCAGICPVQAIKFDFDLYGDYLPVINEKKCLHCGLCVRICPGREVDYRQLSKTVLAPNLNSSLGIKIIRSTDLKMVQAATSGAGVRAVLAHLLETGQVDAVLMIGNQPNISDKIYAEPEIIRDLKTIKYGLIHSRYCPAPLGKILKKIDHHQKYALVGLPCQIQALRKLQLDNPVWQKTIPFAIGLFCGGTPTSLGTKYLFKSHGVKINSVQSVDYRAGGFPGATYGYLKNGKSVKLINVGKIHDSLKQALIGEVLMSNFFRRRRCNNCLDYTNFLADLTFGDPWFKSFSKQITGGSLVVVQNQRGEVLLEEMHRRQKIEIFYNLPANEVKEISDYQQKRWRSFSGIKKFGRYFGIESPRFQGLVNHKYINTACGLFDLICAELGRRESLWSVLLPIQFLRVASRFFLRKIKHE